MNRYATARFLIGVIRFVRPIWALSSAAFGESDRRFWKEMDDRLRELEHELERWLEMQDFKRSHPVIGGMSSIRMNS